MRRFNSNRQDTRRAFTLIEVLVVVLVLSILMAVAVPLYLGAISESQTRACRANMQTIANAETAYKQTVAAHIFTTTVSQLNPNLGSTPTCPLGGTYTVAISDGTLTANNGGTVPIGGLVVSCSALGHGSFAPGVDAD